jgi:hypothetical protein
LAAGLLYGGARLLGFGRRKTAAYYYQQTVEEETVFVKVASMTEANRLTGLKNSDPRSVRRLAARCRARADAAGGMVTDCWLAGGKRIVWCSHGSGLPVASGSASCRLVTNAEGAVAAESRFATDWKWKSAATGGRAPNSHLPGPDLAL